MAKQAHLLGDMLRRYAVFAAILRVEPDARTMLHRPRHQAKLLADLIHLIPEAHQLAIRAQVLLREQLASRPCEHKLLLDAEHD